MTSISKTAIVPYTAAQMFELVDGIEAYPEFLPGCVGSTVLSRNADEVQATLHLGHAGMQKSFTTCNRLQQDKMIEIRLVDGPFKQLEGFWRFENLPNHMCKVSLDLEFEFSNLLMAITFSKVFNQIANTLVDAFCNRATALYGQQRIAG